MRIRWVGKRQLEQLVQAAAVDIDAFYQQKIPIPCTTSTLLVLSVDGKGIVMRPEALRPATAKAAARRTPAFRTRLAAGGNPAASGWPPWGSSTTPNPRHDVRTM
ncbi:hypothetical protein [Streptosporangium roseum]|uniref:hypothetical protein n=1 Tax=Streptosporangium roseum TaxID=2001 RepID=UPI0001A3DE03